MSGIDDRRPFDEYYSHPDKLLLDHTAGVVRRVVERTNIRFAHISAELHDVGKINPHFQTKIRTASSSGYSSHAYLSALTFLSIPQLNRKSDIGLTSTESFRVAMILALHHGNLRNCKSKPLSDDSVEIALREVLSDKEFEKANAFLLSNPKVPFLGFATSRLGTAISFKPDWVNWASLPICKLDTKRALDFLMDAQFAFASLIESDKRDASDNNEERRSNRIWDLSKSLGEGLNKPIGTDIRHAPKTRLLNSVRTEIRAEALDTLRDRLEAGDTRVFCLTSPTGSGKTLTLLALARLILAYRNNDLPVPSLRGILYCLPFLSITEQVETECRKLVQDEDLVLRADSAAHHHRLEELVANADAGDPVTLEKLLMEDFAEQVFDCPLVVTSFVQFFETLMSNRNATLLKLPNFARSVIIVDEIQALPPRLYVFFCAYLDAFCRKFDSYAILSTATMPHFGLPSRDPIKAKSLFARYSEPIELVSKSHFKHACFKRYIVEPRWDINDLENLAKEVDREAFAGNSVLVVLNTIADTRLLYSIMKSTNREGILLLNTRFIPGDRRERIKACAGACFGPPAILITTQLVEAGVNIDFPIVFRDLCPFPNLIQTAGRCNRHNGLPTHGRVILIDIQENGRSRANLIYLTDMHDWYLRFTRECIIETLSEQELFDLQGKFFEKINVNLIIGDHPNLRDDRKASNLISCIRDAAFGDLGKFKLIQNDGDQYAFYVPADASDWAFETLQSQAQVLADAKRRRNFDQIRMAKIEVESHLRKMADRVVQARLKPDEARRFSATEPIMGIRKLWDSRDYTSEYGLEVASDSNII